MKSRLGEIVEPVMRLHKEGEHDKALSLLRRSFDVVPHPYLRVLEGILIQLSNDIESELSDADAAFKDALKIDDSFIEAFTEAGWYQLNVENDIVKAIESFDKAIELSRAQLVEALEGKLKCISEMHPPEIGRRELSHILSGFFSEQEREKLFAAVETPDVPGAKA